MTLNFVITDERSQERFLQILTTLQIIMSKISEFADKQNAHNDAIDSAVSGLTGDIKSLNDKIAELQASAGTVTPEDQALLDAIEARGQSIADKLAALDAQTENAPVPPTEPTP